MSEKEETQSPAVWCTYSLQGHLFILQILFCPVLKLVYNIGSKHCKKSPKNNYTERIVYKDFFFLFVFLNQYIPGRM